MKNILKTTEPSFFAIDTTGLTKWENYDSKKRRKLKKYILENEQHHLCCYCESLIDGNLSICHLEHIRPKTIPKYRPLTFSYVNILVSCNGTHYNEITDPSISSCGHRKNKYFDENNFLDPTLTPDIIKYFKYNKETGEIKSSGFENQKSIYTILLLNLNGNNKTLSHARIIAKNVILKLINTIEKDEDKIIKLNEILTKKNIAFNSYINYCFKKK